MSNAALAQSPEELQRAREEFAEGLALQTAGDCGEAIEKFKSVGRVKMTPHVQFNIALCEERLGHLVAALGHYELALTDARAASIAEVGEHAESAIDELRRRIPRLTLVRGDGAAGTRVEINGVAIGDTRIGTPVRRDPGSHVVRARFGERVVFETSFDLAEGEERTIEIVVEGGDGANSPASGSPPERDVEPSSASRTTLGYVVGGVGIAALATAGVFVYLRQGAIDDLEAQCDDRDCPPSAQSTIDRGRLYTGIAEGGVVLGVAGLATGAILLLTADDEGATASRQRHVALGPGAPGAAAGARLVGRF